MENYLWHTGAFGILNQAICKGIHDCSTFGDDGTKFACFFVDCSGGSKYSNFVTMNLFRAADKGTYIVWERVTNSFQ